MKKTSYGKSNDLNLKLLIALARTNQEILKKQIPFIKANGLTLTQFGVLELLYHKGSLRICEIIEKTLSTGGNMTVVINNLNKSGLIERTLDPHDKRAFLINITPKGEALISKIFPKHLENLELILNGLDEDEKSKLILLLKGLSKI
ncbi:DNA-binding MarR family transcriptional regulator [Acetoanaerobium pronyense]|uniref:DNA-binding MarR family transcriptional regulator n=1 Tax=Acetoanaerobium pronyense TaxID=1482736 RepID=A0ABS4KGL7_9FIRM|nr:MarR family transcriptional regulator [Acetoanaerobium pronyense]MBP2026919.1 DNA-binding MarR family transcriptional regulator [Acetoanaerobium pronyense]